MHRIAYTIIESFKKQPNSELSTSQIVSLVDPATLSKINSVLLSKFSEPSKIKAAKRENAQLHRMILYHINNLVSENILKTTRIGEKGEKFFALALKEGEEVTIEKYHKRSITISKPKEPPMPIEGYEQKGVIYRLGMPSWIDRLNAILLECSMFKDTSDLQYASQLCFQNINDVLGLNNFEGVIQKDVGKSISFLHKLHSTAEEYARTASVIIDLTNIHSEADILQVVKDYVESNLWNNINFIFDLTPKEFHDHADLFEQLIKIYSKNSLQLYIKNQQIFKAPYLIGRAGPYTFNPKEWLLYKKEHFGHIPLLICSQSAIMIDVERFYQSEGRDADKFNHLMERVLHSAFLANSLQRSRAIEYFHDIIKLDESHMSDYFKFSSNYIRFWNYGLKRPDVDQQSLFTKFHEVRKQAEKFCLSEETIYKSCGMPTRFKVAFSSTDEYFVKGIFTPIKFKKLHLSSMRDLYSEYFKEILAVKEKMFTAFNGGDLISFLKAGSLDIPEILRETSFLLNTYHLPLFRFTFQNIRYNDVSLDQFMKGVK